MTDSREKILQKIKSATSKESYLTLTQEFKLNEHESVVEYFEQHAINAGANIYHVNYADEIKPQVITILNQLNVECQVLMGQNDYITALENVSLIENSTVEDNIVAINQAEFAVAETGSLIYSSSATFNALDNFSSFCHIAIIKKENIVISLEQAWLCYPNKPRTLNFITGPSRTGDIEQNIVLGAHGPKQLYIIVI